MYLEVLYNFFWKKHKAHSLMHKIINVLTNFVIMPSATCLHALFSLVFGYLDPIGSY